MFRVLARLFFGREEENPKDKCGEDVVDEEWLLVNREEAETDQFAELKDGCPSNPTVKETEANLETDRMSEPEFPVQSSRSIHSSESQARALAKVTRVDRVQRAQARADRRDLASSYIHRQNCVRQRAQQHHSSRTRSTYLHQPGHRKCNN